MISLLLYAVKSFWHILSTLISSDWWRCQCWISMRVYFRFEHCHTIILQHWLYNLDLTAFRFWISINKRMMENHKGNNFLTSRKRYIGNKTKHLIWEYLILSQDWRLFLPVMILWTISYFKQSYLFFEMKAEWFEQEWPW